jgi:hypothetical protein
MPNYHKIGEPFEADDKPAVFQLIIEDHVDFVHPKKYGIRESFVDPKEYFVTSGDAVEKAKILERDLWKLAGRLRSRVIETIAKECKCTTANARKKYSNGTRTKKPKRLCDYEKAVWVAAGQARRLVRLLEKAKGVDCFFETEWDNHCLLCIPKNPRK